MLSFQRNKGLLLWSPISRSNICLGIPFTCVSLFYSYGQTISILISIHNIGSVPFYFLPLLWFTEFWTTKVISSPIRRGIHVVAQWSIIGFYPDNIIFWWQ
uniref:Uncharacterized protein n=1 Tax=Cacopsylla melanoneura TaxID=428564 RepID=A0A8D9FB12_9HEMI